MLSLNNLGTKTWTFILQNKFILRYLHNEKGGYLSTNVYVCLRNCYYETKTVHYVGQTSGQLPKL